MKRAIAFILTLALCAGLMNGFAFAQEKETFKVVNLGDSTSVGQALDDYGAFGRSGMNSYSDPYAAYYDLGFLTDGSRDAYPAQLARYIQEKTRSWTFGLPISECPASAVPSCLSLLTPRSR